MEAFNIVDKIYESICTNIKGQRFVHTFNESVQSKSSNEITEQKKMACSDVIMSSKNANYVSTELRNKDLIVNEKCEIQKYLVQLYNFNHFDQ